MFTTIKARDYIANMLKAFDEDPSYADEILIMDGWDRHQFGEFVETTFSTDQWLEFTEYCKYNEPTPWHGMYENWLITKGES